MNEKESIIHHIETEGFALSNELIQKLEKTLSIKLKEKSDEGINISKSKQNLKETTIGDIIKIKKKWGNSRILLHILLCRERT